MKEGYLLSFFSSGFASHVRGKAIDIGSVDMDVFYSPVDGVVESMEVVEIGRPNRRAERSYDVVTLIRTRESLVKVLHVEPIKVRGDTVRRGERLGYFISTPYSGGDIPHAHLEGLRVVIPKVTKPEGGDDAVVIRRSTYYLDLEVTQPAWAGKLTGVPCSGGLLNGSIPWACYGGVVGVKLRKGEVNCLGVRLGEVKVAKPRYSLFEMRRGVLRNWEKDASFKVLSNKPVCGRRALMEFVLGYGRNPVVRLYRRLGLKEGDSVSLSEILRENSSY